MNAHQYYRTLVNKAKRVIEFLVYGLFDRAVLASVRKQHEGLQGSVAIVFTKLMGDYFIWLPYGLALVSYLKGLGLHVIFVSNTQWQELATAHYTDTTLLPIDRKQFIKNLGYRRQTLRRLRRLGVREVLSAGYPRDCIIEDAVVRALGGHATGFAAEFPDRPWIDRIASRRLYKRLLPPLPNVHQAARHSAFLRAIGVVSVIAAPLAKAIGPNSDIHNHDYFVVSPGASHTRKMWPADRFVEIARRMLQARLTWRCLLIGAPSERAWIERMQRTLGRRATSVAGRLTLLQLVERIRNARLVIGNDSAAAHIAAACGVPSLAVCPGAEYGRCLPYDPTCNEVALLPVIVAHRMDCFGCGWNCRYHVPHGEPDPCVDLITVESVWAKLSTLLPP